MSSRINQLPWGWIWAASIIGVWLIVAVALGQPVWTQQHSRELVAFGAFRGDTLTWAESWRLIASQWLHVKFPHMLLNALLIGLIGQALTQRFGGALTVGAGVTLGAAGQLAGALLMPDAYISGEIWTWAQPWRGHMTRSGKAGGARCPEMTGRGSSTGSRV